MALLLLGEGLTRSVPVPGRPACHSGQIQSIPGTPAGTGLRPSGGAAAAALAGPVGPGLPPPAPRGVVP